MSVPSNSSGMTTPRPSRKRAAVNLADGDVSSDDDGASAGPPPLAQRSVSQTLYERQRRVAATAMQRVATMERDGVHTESALRLATQFGLEAASRAEALAKEVSRLQTHAFRAERALSEMFRAMLEARGILCGANCGCDPSKEPLLKLSNCTHYVCTSFVTGTVLHLRTTLAIQVGIHPLAVSCPQCRTVGTPHVDHSVLPLGVTSLSIDGDDEFDSPDEVTAMRDFVRDRVRDDRLPARIVALFREAAVRSHIDLGHDPDAVEAIAERPLPIDLSNDDPNINDYSGHDGF